MWGVFPYPSPRQRAWKLNVLQNQRFRPCSIWLKITGFLRCYGDLPVIVEGLTDAGYFAKFIRVTTGDFNSDFFNHMLATSTGSDLAFHVSVYSLAYCRTDGFAHNLLQRLVACLANPRLPAFRSWGALQDASDSGIVLADAIEIVSALAGVRRTSMLEDPPGQAFPFFTERSLIAGRNYFQYNTVVASGSVAASTRAGARHTHAAGYPQRHAAAMSSLGQALNLRTGPGAFYRAQNHEDKTSCL
jgi:hypothetical protein